MKNISLDIAEEYSALKNFSWLSKSVFEIEVRIAYTLYNEKEKLKLLAYLSSVVFFKMLTFTYNITGS